MSATLSLPMAAATTATPWEGAPRPPRRWQKDALPRILEAVRRRKRPIVWACTGAGKSVLLSELARLAERKAGDDRVVLIVTPTQALVRQLAATVAERCGGLLVGRFFADAKQEGRRIVVTCNPSLPELAGRLEAQGRRVALLIADECHRTEAQELRDAIPRLRPAAQIGFTATPFRASEGESLSLWDEVAYRYSYADAMRDGVLVPFDAVSWDGSGEDADTNRVCLDLIRTHAKGPGIVSAVSIADAEDFAAKLCAQGFPAAEIHSALPRREQDRRISALQAGTFACLVHVALLSEGVDLPWLRWICLRRPVGSPVRFIQELGRVLRVHPGKTRATVIDPHDLLGAFGLDPRDPAIGEQMENAVGTSTPVAPSETGEGREGPILPPATAVAVLVAWVRRLLLVLVELGVCDPPNADGGWRGRSPTEAQIRAFQRRAPYIRRLPVLAWAPVEALAKHADQLSRGVVSDLIAILVGIIDRHFEQQKLVSDAQRRWRWPSPDEIPAVPDGAVPGLFGASR